MKSNSESEQTLRVEQGKNVSRRALYETVLILVLTFAAQFLWQDLRIIFAFVPIAYFRRNTCPCYLSGHCGRRSSFGPYTKSASVGWALPRRAALALLLGGLDFPTCPVRVMPKVSWL